MIGGRGGKGIFQVVHLYSFIRTDLRDDWLFCLVLTEIFQQTNKQKKFRIDIRVPQRIHPNDLNLLNVNWVIVSMLSCSQLAVSPKHSFA